MEKTLPFLEMFFINLKSLLETTPERFFILANSINQTLFCIDLWVFFLQLCQRSHLHLESMIVPQCLLKFYPLSQPNEK
jgi:hypothetical protein